MCGTRATRIGIKKFSVVGIFTVMFLKHLNSILKNFATGTEIFFAALASFIFFHIPIDAQTIASTLIIWSSLYIYATNPIRSNVQSVTEDEENLLQNDNK